MALQVCLTSLEYRRAMDEAVEHDRVNKALGGKDKMVERVRGDMRSKAMGLASEVAVSKWIGIARFEKRCDRKKGDLVNGIEVRGTMNPKGPLRIYISDHRRRPFFHVVSQSETEYWITGWLFAQEVVDLKVFLQGRGHRRHWAAAQKKLRSPVTIYSYLPTAGVQRAEPPVVQLTSSL